MPTPVKNPLKKTYKSYNIPKTSGGAVGPESKERLRGLGAPRVAGPAGTTSTPLIMTQKRKTHVPGE